MTHRPLTTLCLTLALLACARASGAQITSNSVRLTWTAPGDDSLVGTASQYDLRYATSPITLANFAAAVRATGLPAPAAAGTSQSFTLTGLTPSTTYYFVLKTADEVPNWSTLSNAISRTTLAAADAVAPARIVTLAVSGITDSTATVRWNAVGDDSLTGVATSYDLRYATSPITAATWGSATQASGEPAPAASGTTQSFTVRGLARQATYSFAIRAVDEGGNVSVLSNVPSATTPDTMSPSSVRDLVAGFVWFGWHSTSAVSTPRSMEVNAR